MNRNHHYLLQMLWNCCQDHQTIPQTPMVEGEEHQKAGGNYSLTVSPDLSRMIGSMIVELITPDVLYNNRFWPEEESLKMTVERYASMTFEPPRDKTNKMACGPSKDSDQSRQHPPSLIRVFAVRIKKAWVLSYPLSAQRRLIRLGGCHFVGFVMRRLIFI